MIKFFALAEKQVNIVEKINLWINYELKLLLGIKGDGIIEANILQSCTWPIS